MTDYIVPKSKGVPSAFDIQAAWQSVENPSQRSMEKLMQAQGWDISASSIIRCVNSGFAPRAARGKKHSKISSPELNAVRQIQKVAPDDATPSAIAAAMVEAIRNLPSTAGVDRIEQLLIMDEKDLASMTRKLYLAAGVLLAEDLAKHTKLMMLAPDKAAKLFQALGSAMAPMIQPPAVSSPGDGAKVVENVPAEAKPLSPSAQAIKDFRSKRGKEAA